MYCFSSFLDIVCMHTCVSLMCPLFPRLPAASRPGEVQQDAESAAGPVSVSAQRP